MRRRSRRRRGFRGRRPTRRVFSRSRRRGRRSGRLRIGYRM